MAEKKLKKLSSAKMNTKELKGHGILAKITILDFVLGLVVGLISGLIIARFLV